MTLRDEIEKARSEFQRTTDQIMTVDDIERIIDRIDDIEESVINKEFDIVTRLSKIEDELGNLSVEFAAKAVPLKRPDFVERDGNRVGDWGISAAHEFTGHDEEKLEG
jgi:tetrahydromethanopterin S-methyltransferase subunit G